MILTALQLKDYRNYTSSQIKFNNGLNVIVGKNAQGKTNMLESIFFASVGRSIRLNKDKDLIKWDKDLAKIKLEFMTNSGNKKIEIYLFRNQNKAIKINGMGISKIGELMGEFTSVFFSPDDLRLVKSSPDERRRFMDIDLSQYDKNYFYALNKYNKVLQQRNKLLKSGANIEETISIWDSQLIKTASYIILKRLELIEKLKKYASKVHSYLTNNQEDLVLSYSLDIEKNQQVIEEYLAKQIKDSLAKDIELGFTTVGPHRDDIKIVSNNIDMRYFGSQGQQRTCALSLKLAELEFFKDNTGEYPVLLLDDVLSELDEGRKNKLLKFVSKFQTIITATEFNENIKHTKFVVDGGKVVIDAK